MGPEENSTQGESRRNVLAKAGKMIIPTLVTFHVSSLRACTSAVHKPGTNDQGGNGNHYGNEKPDGNPQDWKNQYDGGDNPHGRRNRNDDGMSGNQHGNNQQNNGHNAGGNGNDCNNGKPAGNSQGGGNQYGSNQNSNGQGNNCSTGNQQNWRNQYAGFYKPRGRKNP